MDKELAQQTLAELFAYSKEISSFLGVQFEQGGKNNYGPFANGMPCGAIIHYTASNAAYSKKRRYGRYPAMRNRFARGGVQGVGVHFIIWDCLIPRFMEIQHRYPLLAGMPSEVAFMGDDLSFWHAGSANKWAYGIEIRNIGRLRRSNRGEFFNGKHQYSGRTPIKVGDAYWEPYTKAQMEATLWVNRLMCAVHPVRPERFLGHTHISNTRIDPGPHFPIHEMRHYSIVEPDVPLSEVEFLKEFNNDGDLEKREDPMISEEELQEGKYRNDWDGVPDDWDELPGSAPQLETKADLDNYQVMLSSLGYYVTPETVDDTVAIFRSRWKERRPGGKGFRNTMSAAGGMDEKAQKHLTIMASQWDHL